MKQSWCTEEQIIRLLKRADGGEQIAALCRKVGISNTTFQRWKAKDGGLEVNEARRLKHLEDEIAASRTSSPTSRSIMRRSGRDCKKMGRPAAGREAATYLQQHGFSQRRACRLVNLSRATARS